jgi:carbon storage regulator CsrA
MLALSRRVGESIVIELPGGDVVIVKVVSVGGGKTVRLGFDAPDDVEIMRAEVLAEQEDAQ